MFSRRAPCRPRKGRQPVTCLAYHSHSTSGMDKRGTPMDRPRIVREPATWMVVLAFGLLYTSWSTTFFAIRMGVHSYQLPPWLFAGVRVLVAGVILLAFLAWREPG